MTYSIHDYISYILEVNSKRPVREKKIRNRSYVDEIEWGYFLFSNKNIL